MLSYIPISKERGVTTTFGKPYCILDLRYNYDSKCFIAATESYIISQQNPAGWRSDSYVSSRAWLPVTDNLNYMDDPEYKGKDTEMYSEPMNIYPLSADNMQTYLKRR